MQSTHDDILTNDTNPSEDPRIIVIRLAIKQTRENISSYLNKNGLASLDNHIPQQEVDELDLTKIKIHIFKNILDILDHVEYLLQAYITEGVGYQCLQQTAHCMTAISSALTDDLESLPNVDWFGVLRKDILAHQAAANRRAGLGVASAASGALLIGGAAASIYFSFGLSTPLVLGASGLGGVMMPSGTGLAVDAKNKRGEFASCETILLENLLNYYRVTNINAYVQYQLAIILADAQVRGINTNRDTYLTNTISQIPNKNHEGILKTLDHLHGDLVDNSSTSKAAINLKLLIDNLAMMPEFQLPSESDDHSPRRNFS